MVDGDVVLRPVGGEMFEDEAAVAIFGGGFAAEEDGGGGEDLWVEGGLDFALRDQGEEGRLVFEIGRAHV